MKSVVAVGLATKTALWLVSGTAGAVLFWLVQVLTGGPTIPAFMGEQIADAGGYPARFASAIGWAVHLGVSLSYALLFGVTVLLLAATRFPAQIAISAIVAVALGWIALYWVVATRPQPQPHLPSCVRGRPQPQPHVPSPQSDFDVLNDGSTTSFFSATAWP